MYTDLKPFSIVGLPKKMTSEDTILPHKDFHALLKRDFFEELHHKEEPVRSDAERNVVVSVSVLKIALPSAGADDNHDGVDQEADRGCTTPKTAVDHKKSVPPPPSKPKSLPSTKRKAHTVLLDLSREVESLFPPNLLRDFLGGKIKRVRTESIGYK